MAQTNHHINTINDALGTFTTKVAVLELKLGPLAARAFALEAGHGSAARVSGSWSVAVWPHDPGRVVDSRMYDRRLIKPWYKPPDDEHSRSAILLHFPCVQNRAGVTAWFKNTTEVLLEKTSKSDAKAATAWFELCSPPKPCASFFVAQHTDDGLQYSVASFFFWRTPQRRYVFDSRSLKVRARWDAPLLRCGGSLMERYGDDVTDNGDSCPSFDVRSQTLSVADQKHGVILPEIQIRSLWT